MTDTTIHDTAIIDDGADIGTGVTIGPFCHIGPNVKIHDDVTIKSHVVIEGHTEIGQGGDIFPFACLGQIPPDRKYQGEESRLKIGKNCTIREYATLNPGTKNDRMETIVGDNCLLMVSIHVAHDCVLGDGVIMANHATLGGHVKVGDHAIIGGLSGIHQYVNIGKYAMIGGMSPVDKDVIPYGLVKGERAFLAGVNVVGMQRHGMDKSDILELSKAIKRAFGSKDQSLADEIKKMGDEFTDNQLVQDVIEFIGRDTKYGLCQPADAQNDQLSQVA
jgi:UDP-N-acetylglucosamine acyltransferase